jgi:hypothetical protein
MGRRCRQAEPELASFLEEALAAGGDQRYRLSVEIRRYILGREEIRVFARRSGKELTRCFDGPVTSPSADRPVPVL